MCSDKLCSFLTWYDIRPLYILLGAWVPTVVYGHHSRVMTAPEGGSGTLWREMENGRRPCRAGERLEPRLLGSVELQRLSEESALVESRSGELRPTVLVGVSPMVQF